MCNDTRKIISVEVVKEHDVETFEKRINDLIVDDYQPYGEVKYMSTPDIGTYILMMVQYQTYPGRG